MIVLLRTLLSRLLLLIIMAVYLVPTAIFLAIPIQRRYQSKLYNWFMYIFYWLLLKASFLSIIVRGRENMLHEPAIIVANHQSSLDIPLVGSLLHGFPHIWLATSDLMTSPILRFILPRVAVLIDMTSPQKGMRSLVNAINMVDDKPVHTVIFPEGGRYDDGEIHDFYGGFVIIAKKTGRPVVPIRIFNANKVYPKGAFLVQRYPITLVVGPALKQREDESDEAFKERVRAWFLEQK